MLFQVTSFYRRVAALLLVSLTADILFPPVALALTGGPGQPEFSSFEPVGTTNMVDEFTGDFKYNLPVIQVPGPNGSSYSLSLSYHGGGSPEDEASWVGYGWTLSPGAINRGTRGIPDDYKGDITYWNKAPNTYTTALNLGVGMEAFSFDKIGGNLSGNLTLSYNNYTGFGISRGLGLQIGIKSLASANLSASGGELGFSAKLSPGEFILDKVRKNLAKIEDKPRSKLKNAFYYARNSLPIPIRNSRIIENGLKGSNVSYTYAETVRPSGVQEYTGDTYSLSANLEFNVAPLPVGSTANVNGRFSVQRPKSVIPRTALGFMYAGEADEQGKAVQDYYIEKDTPYQVRDLNIGIPFNNADNFIVSGEGIGGGFRVFHRNTGEFYPAYAESNTTSHEGGGEVSLGMAPGYGADIVSGKHRLSVSRWLGSPRRFSSLNDNTVDEPVFFKFNNELGGSWKSTYASRGTVRLKQSGGHLGTKTFDPVTQDVYAEMNEPARTARASYIGFNVNQAMVTPEPNKTSLKAYTKRKDIEAVTDRNAAPDAVGEFAITTATGQQYLYGLPLYNRKETNLAYGVQGLTTVDNYLVYGAKEDKKVGQEMSATPYATTFLLTEVNTPDYIDRTMDGPTEDDFGGYTLFAYDKLYGYKGNGGASWYNWRIPYNGMLYDRGALSDPQDDMGTVAAGEKEVALLKYVQTKTHIAVFRTTDRVDGVDAPVAGARTEKLQGKNRLKKLTRIDLYLVQDIERKADGTLLLDAQGLPQPKTGKKAIKSVRFKYSRYDVLGNRITDSTEPEVWPGIPNGPAGAGKLTLSKVWFEYNEVSAVKISPYQFEYLYPDATQYPTKYSSLQVKGQKLENPAYNALNVDAWNN